MEAKGNICELSAVSFELSVKTVGMAALVLLYTPGSYQQIVMTGHLACASSDGVKPRSM
jgi:hypothetical protein